VTRTFRGECRFLALWGHLLRESASIRVTGSCWAIPDPFETFARWHRELQDQSTRIGILVFGSPSDPPVEAPFVDGLRDLGWIEGKNIVIERRYAENRSDRLQAIASELVRMKVDVLAAPGTDLSDAAKNATTTIPVVMGASADPVEKGLVASLAHPGGNITGMAFMSPQLSPKRLELLKEAIPGVVRVAVLWDPTYSDQDFKPLRAAASALGLQI
jgi:putative tryptophan/tyrosine transport system substrate-binding protein